MKVAYLLGSVTRGGTETLLLDIFYQARSTSFDIIGIYRKEGPLSESFHSSGLPVVKLAPSSISDILHYLWRLRKLLEREKVDIAHAQQPIDALYARIASLGRRVKVVLTFHGYDFQSGRLGRFLIRFSLVMVDMNIFVSETQCKYYKKSYKLQQIRQAVIYNGIKFEKFIVSNDSSIRKELGVSENSLLIGMVGSFLPIRDQMTICHFLDLLKRKGIDFTFLFIGKKDDTNSYLFEDCLTFCRNNNLMDKVLFLGSRNDIPAILPQLDAFIYSSNHDTFGIAVIEAIAAGIPVFVNDWEVMKEITGNGSKAILYRTKNAKDLYDKFLDYLKQPQIYRKAAVENAAWARETYNIQSHIEHLRKIYSTLM